MKKLLLLLTLMTSITYLSAEEYVRYDKNQLDKSYPMSYYRWTYSAENHVAYINTPDNMFAAIFRDHEGAINLYLTTSDYGEYAYTYYKTKKDDPMKLWLSPLPDKNGKTLNASVHLRYTLEESGYVLEDIPFYDHQDLPFDTIIDMLTNGETFYFSMYEDEIYFTLSLKNTSATINKIIHSKRVSNYKDIALFDYQKRLDSWPLGVDTFNLDEDNGFRIMNPEYRVESNKMAIKIYNEYGNNYYLPNYYKSTDEILRICDSTLSRLLMENYGVIFRIGEKISGDWNIREYDKCVN